MCFVKVVHSHRYCLAWPLNRFFVQSWLITSFEVCPYTQFQSHVITNHDFACPPPLDPSSSEDNIPISIKRQSHVDDLEVFLPHLPERAIPSRSSLAL